ncbi:hypothetical protein C1I62_06320 [Streptococcus intermedius]|uniref:DUF1642 domain-containing protein n=1 Tax=Streptococcus intermedius TaxID=1338 RepID=UPI000C829BBC|nr:DUF1642 domain-containing protein [Streptococcus intermedius]PMR65763.1 hypothetical protein C1I62_06320 [Streptococcus intermedius]
MNKQEAIDSLKKDRYTVPFDAAELNYNAALDKAIGTVRKIDEPERVKITKAQEDYLLGFGDIENEGSEDWTVALYYIVRVGWGYLFTTGPNAGSDKIPLNSDYYKKLSGNLDVDDLKTLLIKALVNGYEVEKEKLYTAKLKLITISYVNYINKRSDGAIILSDLNTASGVYQTSFTQSELEELDIWDNPVFEIEEVK